MKRPWTPDEDETIRINYPDFPTFLVAFVIDRTERATYQRAAHLGLKKSAKFNTSPWSHRKNGHEPGSVAHRFKKGVPSWSKGTKGRVGVQEGCRATQFKKGRPAQEARNYRPIGSERICKDGYLERKVSDDPTLYPARRWMAVHRIVWESVNGAVPPGHAVVFKPGGRTTKPEEITLDVVELVTRAELMRRNSYHNYPQPIPQLIQLRGALQRQINKASKA